MSEVFAAFSSARRAHPRSRHPEVSEQSQPARATQGHENPSTARVRVGFLKARLGEGAWFMWLRLCRARSLRDGSVTLSLAEMARLQGFEALTPRQAQLAVDRLTKAGLICNRGERSITERAGELSFRKTATVRVVLGTPPNGRGDALACVPSSTANWMQTTQSWGGKRSGAGRPKQQASSRQAKANDCDGLGSNGNKQSRWYNLYRPLRSGSGSGSGSDPIPSFGRDTGAAPELALNCLGASDSHDLGQIIGSAPVRRIHPAALGLACPGVPGPITVTDSAGVKVPCPPLLRAEDSPERCAFLLSRWYVGAIQARTGQHCYAFSRGPIQRSKHYSVLVRAAQAFIANEIAPAAWCAFSLQVWQEHKPGTFPPVRWVFSTSRIEQREGWFRREAEDWEAGRIMLTSSGRKLLERQAAMRRALAVVASDDAEGTAKIVRRFFPRDSFNALLQAAQDEAAEQERDIRSRTASGDWVW